MLKFRMVALREAPWCDRIAKTGETVLVIAAKTEAEARWFFGRIEWSAWKLESIPEDPTPKRVRAPAPQEQSA
jgi:hypothetical protein